MADLEKSAGEDHRRDAEHHDTGLPDHLEDMTRTRTEIDVIQTTTENPYLELNFIGTYVAIALATCAVRIKSLQFRKVVLTFCRHSLAS